MRNDSRPDVRSTGLDTGSGGLVSAKGVILALRVRYCNGPEVVGLGWEIGGDPPRPPFLQIVMIRKELGGRNVRN